MATAHVRNPAVAFAACLLLSFLVGGEAAGRPDGPHIVRTRIVGGDRVSEETLLQALRSRPGTTLDEAAVDEDIKTLWARFGVRAVVDQIPTAGGVELLFRVEEEPLVRRVEAQGVDPGRAAELLGEVGLAGARALLPGQVLERARRMERRLREEGRPDARVEVRFDPEDGGARALLVIHEGEKVEVEAVEFSGLDEVDPDDLLDVMETRPTRFFVFKNYLRRDALRRDVAALEQYLHDEGYRDAAVGEPEIERSPEGDAARVTIPVEEGPRYRVEGVEIVGGGDAEGFDPQAAVRLAKGDPLRARWIERDQRALLEALAALGYLRARVEPDVLFAERGPSATVRYRIAVGPRVHVADVRIQGNESTRDEVLRREVQLAPGDVASLKRLRRTAQRLRALGLFVDAKGNDLVDVRFVPVDDRDDEVDVLVQVEERESGQFLFTLAGETDRGLFAGIQLKKKNFDWRAAPSAWDPFTVAQEFWRNEAFHGAGQELSIDVLPGNRFSTYDVRFHDPYHGGDADHPVALDLEAYGRTERLFSEFQERRFGVSVGFERGREKEPRRGWFARLEAVSIGRLDDAPKEVEREKGVHFVPAVGASWRRESFDSPLDPHEGKSLGARGELLLGEAFGARLMGEASRIYPLPEDDRGRRRSLALRGSVGVAQGFLGSLPFYERLLAGGASGSFPLRGFSFRGVGPTEDGVPVGGAFAWTGSAELRFPLYSVRDPLTDELVDRLRGILFVDVGGVDDTPFAAPRLAVGAGVRLTLPFLGPTPVALDFAAPLLSASGDDTQFVNIHVSTRF